MKEMRQLLLLANLSLLSCFMGALFQIFGEDAVATETAAAQQSSRLKDRRISHRLHEALRKEPALAYSSPVINVQKQVVTLRGQLSDRRARQVARKIIKESPGVKKLIDRAEILPPGSGRSWQLTRTLRLRLSASPSVESTQVMIAAQRGKVYLGGIVKDQATLREVEKIAKSTPGVTEVINNMRIGEPEQEIARQSTSTPVAPPRPRAPSSNGQRSAQNANSPAVSRDLEMAAEIRQRLLQDPIVESQQVRVKVERGVAYLSGRVDNFDQERAVLGHAQAAGAVDIKNSLAVAGARSNLTQSRGRKEF